MTQEQAMRHLRTQAIDDTTTAPSAYYDKSWALVVGIDDYGGGTPRLLNARNDATAVAKLLKEQYNFEPPFTLYDSNATCNALLTWLRDDLPAKVGDNDRLVFFFAGHGATSRNSQRGYLVPYDAEKDKYARCVDMEELLKACGNIRAKHILVILDCCFSGVAAVTTRAPAAASPPLLTDAYLQDITKRRAWQVLTAGATDQLVADSGRRPGHSAFTSALLSGLEGQADQNADGIITASELANYIKPEVSRETGRHGGVSQHPFFSYLAGSGQGDFVFIRPDQPVHIATTKPGRRPTSPVLPLLYWPWVVLTAFLLIGGMLGWYAWNHTNKIYNVPITFFSYPDNDNSKVIAHQLPGRPINHEGNPIASGVGSYDDPITAAAAADNQRLPLGTLIYVPLLQKYLLIEEECGDCGNNQGINIWMESNADFRDEVLACEAAWTPDDHIEVEVDPPSGHYVDPTPFFDVGTGVCHNPPSPRS